MATWSWKIKTAVSELNGYLAEMLSAAETGGIKTGEEVHGDDHYRDANTERFTSYLCEVLEFSCFDDGEERDGVGRS